MRNFAHRRESTSNPGTGMSHQNDAALTLISAEGARHAARLYVNETSTPHDRNMAEKKIGRPSKGNRDTGILAKPDSEFGKILRANAEAANFTFGDYLVLLAAERLNMPQYAPKPSRDRVNELRGFPEEIHTTAA